MVFGLDYIVLAKEADEKFQFPLGIRWCSDALFQTSIWKPFFYKFQFPLGIRWCSDGDAAGELDDALGLFQFPLGIRWCSDPHYPAVGDDVAVFQFPLGIRWCSDFGTAKAA